jgi:hypothetical protein
MSGARVGIAILDSGIAHDHPAFEGYELRHFDLTGEGPYDYNGHGTAAAGIAIRDLPPSSVVILNIKIMNKFLELDEVTMLQGIAKACEELDRLPNTRGIVNLSAGIRKEKREDCYACRKFRQLARRHGHILFVAAAGNDGVDLDTTDALYIPLMCGSIEVPRDALNRELFEDAVYFARAGKYDAAQGLLAQIANSSPDESLNAELVSLNRTIVFVQFALRARSEGQHEAAQQWFAAADPFNKSYVDLSRL